jgi:tetratricopeptide (TPR) repeat protein
VAARPGTLDLPHRAYIEALADAPEGSAHWHAIVAGYAALQLFESWMEGGLGATAPGMLDLWRVRRYVEAVPERHPARRCLSHLVDAIVGATVGLRPEPRSVESAEVARVLGSYAKLLQYDALWGLAADVHGTIVEFAQRTNDVPCMLDSMLMLGYSRRMQGRFDEATSAYAALRVAAVAAKDVRYELESHLSDAKVAIDRGNLPLARDLLDRTIAEGRRSECWPIVAKGLGDRARVALGDHDHDLALACLYEAHELASDAPARERILSNIALTFAQMGLRDAARDAALLVAGTAQDRTTRLTAMVNLMELAHGDGRELVFEQYRRALATEELTPYLEATYLETCVIGLRTFGRHVEARHAAKRMLDVAERHGLNELLLKAEALLRDADATPRPQTIGSRTPTARSITIARAISDMRIAAGLPD